MLSVTNKPLMLSVIMQIAITLSVIMQIAITLSVIILCIIMLSVVMLWIIILSVAMLSVVAPVEQSNSDPAFKGLIQAATGTG
jgi:hypothetical protein